MDWQNENRAPLPTLDEMAGKKLAAGAQNQMTAENKAASPHPREFLPQDINDQEQRLLDKLVALRELRQEFMFLHRDEAERIAKITRLAQRIS